MKKFVSLLPLLFILTGCNELIPVATNPEYFSQAARGLNQAKQISEQAKKQAVEANALLNDEPAPVGSAGPLQADLVKKYYKVVNVVDGDTIDVQLDGQTERLRLLGINTPEVVDPRKPVECFGREASAKAHELLDGQEVELEADPSQINRDKYSRLLRYARTKEGLFYNLEIIKLGYAYEYTYDLPYKYQTEFKAAQKEAQNKKAGLWADGACRL
ncbi:MAG: thermonuclease family protein [Parcubacteria group bacterium]